MRWMKLDLKIKCADSVTLQAVLEYPASPSEPMVSCLICHPHPLYGGDMNNNVVGALSHSMIDAGIATLRFNFRGVGKSSGSYGEGISEMLDVTACIDHLSRNERLDSSKILLGGYSFGSWVAMKTAQTDQRPSRLMMISPPLDMYDFSFLASEKRPKLMVGGDGDFVCSVKRFEEFSEGVADPKMSVILKGHDHFHWGLEEAVTSQAREFLSRYPV